MLELLKTKDNSYTLYNQELNETYHSKNGALQESLYVFIEKGLLHLNKKENIKILEVGFGTGLNAILTYKQAKSNHLSVKYTSLEPYPVPMEIIQQLDYAKLLELNEKENEFFLQMHASIPESIVQNGKFDFRLSQQQLLSLISSEKFDLIYFDAFAPDKQPVMWTAESLQHCYDLMSEGAVFVTYCAKGEVKRTLKTIGFKTETLPGPPGKREMIRQHAK